MVGALRTSDFAVPAAEPRFEADEIVGYTRSASDAARLLAYGLTSIGLLLLTRWAENAILGLEADVVGLLNFLDPPAERVLANLAQLLSGLIGLGVFVVPLVLKRYRLLGYLLLGNILSSSLVAGAVWWLGRNNPQRVVNELARRAGVNLDAVLTPSTLAGLAASFVILAPFVNQRWRRAGVWMIVALTVLQLLLSLQLSAEAFLALALGATTGAALLLAFGRPDQHPTMRAVAAALTVGGFEPATLDAGRTHQRVAQDYVARLASGDRIAVEVISPAERSADLLVRMYRYLRLKNLGDERPFSSLRRAVEHEALVSLQARDNGVRTPRLRTIAEVGSDSMLLAFDLVEGRSLEEMADDEVDDTLVDAIWAQVEALRARRIAHRDLRQSNILVDADGRPWIRGFTFSEVAVDDAVLDADVAQFIATLAGRVGAERAVDRAIAVLGEAVVRAALPRLQFNALSDATRAELRHRKGFLKELQATVAQKCGVSEPEYVPLERLSRKTMFTVVMLVAVTYFLLPQLTDLPGILDQIKEVSWLWLPPLVVASGVTYLGATLAIDGSVPVRLRFAPTFLAQIAASFAGTLAPSSVGGLALNGRYLQKSGVDPPVAVSGVGLNAVAGLVMHLALLVVFLVWAGRSASDSVSLPSGNVFVLAAIVLVALAALLALVPPLRRMVARRVLPVIRRSLTGLGAVLRSPLNLALLFGGSTLVTAGYLVAIYFSTRAFGGQLTFAEVGAVYLVASAIATAAPTPGGLGALEAAAITGLVAAGMPNASAVPAVFLFRLATFWLPILPGWIAFHFLQHEDYL